MNASLSEKAGGREVQTASNEAPPRPKSKLYLSAGAEARRMLGKRITATNVVEHLLHDKHRSQREQPHTAAPPRFLSVARPGMGTEPLRLSQEIVGGDGGERP